MQMQAKTSRLARRQTAGPQNSKEHAAWGQVGTHSGLGVDLSREGNEGGPAQVEINGDSAQSNQRVGRMETLHLLRQLCCEQIDSVVFTSWPGSTMGSMRCESAHTPPTLLSWGSGYMHSTH